MDLTPSVQRVVVHQIRKERMSKDVNPDLSMDLLTIDDRTKDLIKRLNNSYRNSKIVYAVFDSDPRTFPELYNSYNESQTDDDFLDISKKAVQSLIEIIKNIPAAKGGYLVFAQYDFNGKNFFSIYLIRNTAGMIFKKNQDTESFEIDPTTHLDLDKLAMACRVNNSKYSSSEGKYLSFIHKSQSDISEYFINWIAAVQQESNTTYTEALFQLTCRIPLPKDDNDEEIDREDFQNRIYSLAYSKPDKTINLRELGQHFYDDENYFVDQAEQLELVLDTEFRYDNRAMKKFVRVDIDKEGVRMRFNRNKITSGVISADGDQVIIRSSAIAEIIRQEMN